jgi:hypothetical protein
MSSFGQQWRPVHGGPVSQWSKNQLSWEFCKEAPRFLYNQAAVPKFAGRPLVFEIFPKIPLATFQKFQIGPYNYFSPYLCNRNSDFGDSCSKILRITSSFILCIYLTHVCCILLIDGVCFALGNAIHEPFFDDFQFQAFEESHLILVDQQGKLP